MEAGAKVDFVVVGFPKCGTSALMREFESFEEVHVGKGSAGELEVNLIDTPPKKLATNFFNRDKINGHKYSAYIFHKGLLSALNSMYPDLCMIVCVREPVKSLISWHKMHQSVAKSGRHPEHFAYRQRDFYASCSISEYYQAFAKQRLQYDRYLNVLTEIVDENRLILVSQDRLAEGVTFVARDCINIIKNGSMENSTQAISKTRHLGYADKATVQLDDEISNDLAGITDRLTKFIRGTSAHKLV